MTETEFQQLYQHHKRVPKSTNVNKAVHALVDTRTYRVLAISNLANTIRILSELPNTVASPFANASKYWVTEMDAETCIYWKYAATDRVEAENFQDFDEYMHALLFNEKAAALDKLTATVSRVRRSMLLNDTFAQGSVYRAKYDEAVDWLNGKTAHTVFLMRYADQNHISVTEAANNIVAKHQEYRQKLFLTEELRLRYTKRIVEEQEFFAISTIIDDLSHEAMVQSTKLQIKRYE